MAANANACSETAMRHNGTGMKVAIVHDWLPTIGGAERVLEQLTQLFPQADIFTLFDFLTEEQRRIFGNCSIHASYLNRLPRVSRYYRNLLPLFPGAVESFDLQNYDLVISSSYSVAKGVITSAEQVHISYVHSPARYAWDLTHHYLKQTGSDRGVKGALTRHLLKRFRIWDYRTANGVDQFVANSNFIAKRIWKVYRREASVVYPPVDVHRFTCCTKKEDFYFTASRMVPYKRMDLIVEAFTRMPEKRLVVIGDGPEMPKIARIADGHPNIEILGYQDNDTLVQHMQRAKAFVFAAEEDFGIIPVEAQACGTPVIAYKAGGTLETVRDFEGDAKSATGMFFESQTADAIQRTVERFDRKASHFDPSACRTNAERFAPEIFRERIKNIVARAQFGTDAESPVHDARARLA